MRKPLILLLILMISVSARTWSLPVLSYDPATDTVFTMTVNKTTVCNGAEISFNLECTGLSDNLKFFIRWTADTTQPESTILDSTDMSSEHQVQLSCSSSLGSGYYQAIVVSADNYRDSTFWKSITVLEPFVAAVIPDSSAICHNKSASIQITALPSGAGEEFTYSWYELNSNNTFDLLPSETNSSLTTPALTDNKTYKVEYISNACPSATGSDTISITVFQPITAGTLSGNQNICHNTETIVSLSEPFSGGSGADGFSYQWEKSTDSITWDSVASTSNEQLQTGALTSDTWFRMIATDDICNVRQNTAPAKITVYNNISAPVIATTTDTICDNMSAIFTIQTQASGGENNFSYQWQKKNHDDSWANTDVTVNGSNYSTEFLNENTTFKVIATDEQCGDTTSNEILITVLNDFNRGQLTDTAICSGTRAKIKFNTKPSGYGNQYNYNWEVSTNGNTYSTISNAYGDSLETNLLSNNISYRVSITPKHFCTNRTAYDTVLVTVNPAMTPGTILDFQTICYNSKPSAIVLSTPFSGGSGAEGFGYKWMKSSDASRWTQVDNDTIYSILRPDQLTADTWFKLDATDSVCNVTRSTGMIKVTVLDSISIPVIESSADTVCINQGTNFTIITNATGGGNSFDYQWQKKNDNGDWTDTTMTLNSGSYSTQLLNSDTEFRVVATDNASNCGSKASEGMLITVLDDFSRGLLVDDTTICHSSTAKIRFSTSTTGFGSQYNYDWELSSDGTTYLPVPDASGDTLITPTHTNDVWYRVAVTPQKFCTDRRIIVDTVQISVLNALAAGSVEGTDTLVCYGTAPSTPVTLSTDFSGGSGQYNYQWRKFATGGGTPTAITGANTISYQPGNHTGDTCYQLMITDAVCGSTSFSSNYVVIKAYDSIHAPVLSSTTTDPICFRTAPGVINVTTAATGGNNEFTYQWQRLDSNNQWADISGATSSDFYQPDTLQASTQFQLLASTDCGNKSSLPVQITVYPQLSIGTLGGDTTICNGQNANLYFNDIPTGGGDSFTYIWEQSNGDSYLSLDTSNSTTMSLISLTSSSYYRVQVLSDYGCGNGTTDSVFVKVWDALTPPVLPSDIEVCSGSSITLNATSPASGGDTNYTYTWQKYNSNPGKAGDDNTPKYDNTVPPHTYYANLGSGYAYFNVICNNGCGAVTSNTMTVKINPLPTIPTLLGDTTIHCSNERNLEYKVDNNTALNYLWTMPNSTDGEFLSDVDSSAVLVHWYEGVTEATLALNLKYKTTGCQIDVSYDNIHIDTSNHAPNKTHIALKRGAGILICEDNHPDAHYLWGMIEKATGIETTIENSDCRYIQLPNPIDTARYDYYVDIWYGKGPCVTRTYYLRDERGVDWWSDANVSMNVHPNPSFGEVFYTISEDIQDSYQINVYNTVGHLVYTQQCDSYNKDTQQKLNKTLDKGTYIMSIVTSNGVLTQKIIVK